MEQILIQKNIWIDPNIKKNLDIVKKRVLTKDRDFVAVIDGEEGVGKSVLAQQLASYLDPNFNIDNIVFNADEFIKKIRNQRTGKGSCIIMDEAFSSANARSSISEVNKAMIGVATEMRQRNLFILLCIPSFFDLDRYFALWRCRSLVHVYFTPNEERRYIVFNKEQKKMLYLQGKRTYSYKKPLINQIPSHFPNVYTVDEQEYRRKKAYAFRRRIVSHQARNWMLQRNAFIKFIVRNLGLTQEDIGKIPMSFGAPSLSQDSISLIIKQIRNEDDL